MIAVSLALVLLLGGLPGLAGAEPTYDEYGLQPEGGDDWHEPSSDGHRPEPIAPDEEELDPFDERVIELEPEVRIAPDFKNDPVPPPPSRETPEPLLPPVEQILKEGPRADPRQLDPTGLEQQERQREVEQADPKEW